MAAELLAIVGRNRPSPIGLAEPGDFRTATVGETDVSLVLRPEVSLYCLDDARRRALFVECDPGVDLAAAPFYYQAQFEHARRLVAISYDMLHRVAGELPDPGERLVLLYSTGRCGSTLLSRAFAQVPGVVSLSEPDVPTQLVALRPTDGSRDAELRSLAADCVKLICKPPGPGTGSGQRHVLKFRSMGIEIADLLHRAFPEARSMFLYRGAEAVIASSLRAFVDAPPPPDASTPEGRELIARFLSWVRGGPARILLRALAGGVHAAITRGDFRVFRRLARAAVRLGREEPAKEELFAVLWMSVVARYVELHRQGVIPVAFRYETLVESPRQTLEAVFRHAGLPPEIAAGSCDVVMARDAQEGSPLARERTRRHEGDAGSARRVRDTAWTVAAMDRRVGTPDYVAPGTWTLAPDTFVLVPSPVGR
jgi:hypothetical protein